MDILIDIMFTVNKLVFFVLPQMSSRTLCLSTLVRFSCGSPRLRHHHMPRCDRHSWVPSVMRLWHAWPLQQAPRRYRRPVLSVSRHPLRQYVAVIRRFSWSLQCRRPTWLHPSLWRHPSHTGVQPHRRHPSSLPLHHLSLPVVRRSRS